MSVLITSDIHMSENPLEEYRWGLFNWIDRQFDKRCIDAVLILGDLTVAKDRHSAALVNRLARELHRLAELVGEVYVLTGNHDFIDPDTPFFGFLDNSNGISFIKTKDKAHIRVAGKRVPCLFLPSRERGKPYWEVGQEDLHDTPYVFAHETFRGAISESGQRLDGVDTKVFANYKGKIWAGDIHIPQRVGPVEYVGAPYRTRFGDNFTPRVVYIDEDGEDHSLRYPCPMKHVLSASKVERLDRVAESLSVKKGDHVKVKMRLKPSDYPEWPKIKDQVHKLADERGWVMHGVVLERASAPAADDDSSPVKARTPEDLVREYAAKKGYENGLLKAGLRFIKAAT